MEQFNCRGRITIADDDEGSFFLAVQSASAAQGTLLFIGSGVLADSLAKVLSSEGMKLQRAAIDHALASARTHAPALVVLAGDAARDRGLSIRTRLDQLDKGNPLPVLVILAPELGGLATQPLPRHVGYLAPTGGVNECARRVQAVVELFMDEGLASCSLQQLADTVTSRGKGASAETTSKAAPPPLKTSQAAEPTLTSKAAPPPLKISYADYSPDKLENAANSAPAQSKAAPPPLKITHSPAAVSVSDEPNPQSLNAAMAPAAVELKLSSVPANTKAATLLGVKAPAATPAAVSSKAAASAFSSGVVKPTANPFAAVPMESAAKSSKVASAEQSTPSLREAAAVSGKPAAVSSAPVQNADPFLLFESLETSAGLKRPEPRPAARAAASPRQPTPPDRDEAQTSRPKPAPAAPEKPRSNSDRPTKRPKRKGAATRAKASSRAPGPKPSISPSGELDISIALSEAPPSMPSEQEPVTFAPPAAEHAPAAAAQPVPLRAAHSVLDTVQREPLRQADKQAQARAGRETVQSRTRTRLGMPHDPAAVSDAANTAASATAMEAADPRPKTRELRAVNGGSSAERRPKTGDHAAAPSLPAADNSARRPKTGEFVAARSLPAAADGTPRKPTRDILASPSFAAPSSPANDNAAAVRKPTARDILAAPSFPANDNSPANDNAAAVRKPSARDILAAPSFPANDNSAAARKPTARDILAAPTAPVRARTPLDTPSTQHAALPASPSRKRRWPIWLGLAAVGCTGLAFYGMYMQPNARDSGHAALGSLEQVPALATPSETVSPAAPSALPSAAPVPRTRDASANASSASAQSPNAGAPRPGGKEREPDPGSELGRARALVAEGTTLQSQGRLGLAESAYQKALTVMPEYPGAMAALVRVHLARRDGAEALRWATRLVAKQPKDAMFQLLLGDALALRGDLQGARDAWTDAAERGNAMARQRLQ